VFFDNLDFLIDVLRQVLNGFNLKAVLWEYTEYVIVWNPCSSEG